MPTYRQPDPGLSAYRAGSAPPVHFVAVSEHSIGPAASPSVSVIVPTYNRRERLLRTLDSLARQTFDGELEVVVVSDGSTDGTVECVRSRRYPMTVRVVDQANAGPSAARNAGVADAVNDLVVFIDDDVVAAPELIERHVATHAASDEPLAVIGPMLTPDDAELSSWVAWEQEMLYKQYRAFEDQPEASFRQFYTGNASVPRSALVEVGGFDTRFRRAEDVELAYRLRRAGLGFRFCASARAHHYAERSFASWRSIARDYGTTTVVFSREGPEFLLDSLIHELHERHRVQRRVVRTLLRRPWLASPTQRVLGWAHRSAAAMRADTVARHLLSLDWASEFYRGAADELGSPERLLTLIDSYGVDPDLFSAVLLLEQTLGHVTHTANLRSALDGVSGVELGIRDVPFETGAVGRRVPLWSNWTVRAGLRARRAFRAYRRRYPALQINALFVHTQVPAVLLGRLMARYPTVVSLDATPVQYDALGESYAHEVGPAPLERIKHRLNQRCFRRAAHLVTWSAWARDSLVADYAIAPDRITVVPPGVDPALWRFDGRRRADDQPVGVLFVGGDLERKGGNLLVEAAQRLRADPAIPEFELHLVTRSAVAATPGVFAYHDLSPNSPELIALYQRCEIFCLPTLGDCLPMVLAEAGATGLALISTDVGAIREIVRDGSTGRLIPPGSTDAIEAALRELLTDPGLRRGMGAEAARLVAADHDAQKNARRVMELVAESAGRRLPSGWHERRTPPA